jgi:hypothetical protein
VDIKKSNILQLPAIIIVLCAQPVFGEKAEMLSPEKADAVLAYFHQFAESPDGLHVAYTLFDPPERMLVVVHTLSTGKITPVAMVKGQNRHTGAHPLWVDNHTLIYCSDADYRIYHHDLKSGNVVEYAGGQISDYSPLHNMVLYNGKNAEKEEKGLYSIDLDNGSKEQLISLDDMAELKDEVGIKNAIEHWRLDHPYWSPDGQKIMFQLKTFSGKARASEVFLFYTDPEATKIHYVGIRPMHVQWWDNESYFGHDNHEKNDKHLRRWDLDGKMIEELSGPGCHGTVSADRQWIVTESWYKSDPIIVNLYKRGETKPTQELFRQPAVVKGKVFWDIRSHIHPSFSRDGQRAYFNAQGPDGKSKVWFHDLQR